MIKLFMTVFLGCLMFSLPTFADANIDNMMSKKEASQTTKKKTRRKKVQMCHECGKPETECECEGEEHGVHDDKHDDKHDAQSVED